MLNMVVDQFVGCVGASIALAIVASRFSLLLASFGAAYALQAFTIFLLYLAVPLASLLSPQRYGLHRNALIVAAKLVGAALPITRMQARLGQAPSHSTGIDLLNAALGKELL